MPALLRHSFLARVDSSCVPGWAVKNAQARSDSEQLPGRSTGGYRQWMLQTPK